MPEDSSGRLLTLNLRGGVSPINALTGTGYGAAALSPGAHSDANVLGDTATVSPLGPPKASPAWWIIGAVVILVIMHIAGRHPKLGEVTDNFAGVNIWNFISQGLSVFVFLLALKLGVNKAAPTSTLANVVNFV